jgi:hypothetical protein
VRLAPNDGDVTCGLDVCSVCCGCGMKLARAHVCIIAGYIEGSSMYFCQTF